MLLNEIIFVLLFMFMEDCVAGDARSNGHHGETRSNDHHRLIERLESIEEEQRDSRTRIETLERTVKSQAQIIKSQSRDIKGFEFIVHKHRARVQHAYRQSRQTRREIIMMRKVLMDAGLIMNKKSNSTSTEPNEQHAVVAQDKVRHRELVDTEGERHEPEQQVQGRITKRHATAIGQGASKRQERAGISFSVYLDHDVDLGAHQTIKFNQIITNEGNGYSPHSGVFTCPEAGMYLFSFFIGQRDEAVPRGILAELMVNSKNVLDAIVDSHSIGQDITGGNMAVIRLNQGDVVWVDSFSANGHAEGSTGFKLTSFSGIFLYP